MSDINSKVTIENSVCNFFDSDKRKDKIDGMIIVENPPFQFDPDKRIDRTTVQVLYDTYDPDKRIEISEDREKILKDYFDDLRSKSDFPESIPKKPFNDSDIEKRTPEENAAAREEFDNKKEDLKREWEKENGREWPKYEKDVYSSNGRLIRKAGSDYDAHHIQPLSMGGKNEAKNITPLHAEVHYDKQGVHAPNSPYSKLDNILGGN